MSWFRLFALLALLPLAACSFSAPHPATYPVETKGPYTLDTGDLIRINVYGEASLTNSYRVDDSGAVSVPLIGSIMVRGGTTQNAASRISAALANGFMREPNVAVEVAEYRPFFIEGEVKTAGKYPYVYGMTVRAAIATAGGFSETANRGYAVLYRQRGAEMVKGAVGLDFPIYPGDTVVIDERWL